MSDVNATTDAATPDNASVLRLIQACKAARATGRVEEADRLLARVAQLAPEHPAVLNELGLRMVQRGDASRARELRVGSETLEWIPGTWVFDDTIEHEAL